MLKSLAFTSVIVTLVAAPAFAAERSHRAAPLDAADYYAIEDAPTAAPTFRTEPLEPRSDFGAFSTGNVARNLGY